MKTFFKHFLSLSALVALSVPAFAQQPATVWTDSRDLPLLGKGVDDASTSLRYQRIPDSLQSIVKRPFLYTLGLNSSGMALRFRSNSSQLKARWLSTQFVGLHHMTETGIRGLDLYALADDSTWTFVNSARPRHDSPRTETTIISNMRPGTMREYMLFLSLYDGVDSLYIGHDAGTILEGSTLNLPRRDGPMVFYGTSIMQGCSASRPGMSHVNQLCRRLNREAINFGFSGNGQLDLEIAELIANIPDPSVIVLDFAPNANDQQVDTLMIPFFQIIRRAHPSVPVLFVEDPHYPHARFDTYIAAQIDSRNAVLRRKFDELVALGYDRISLLPSDDMLGHDAEATVDGIHFTDVGFIRYADLLAPILQSLISN